MTLSSWYRKTKGEDFEGNKEDIDGMVRGVAMDRLGRL